MSDPELQEQLLGRAIRPNFLRGDELETVLDARWETIQTIAASIK